MKLRALESIDKSCVMMTNYMETLHQPKVNSRHRCCSRAKNCGVREREYHPDRPIPREGASKQRGAPTEVVLY